MHWRCSSLVLHALGGCESPLLNGLTTRAYGVRVGECFGVGKCDNAANVPVHTGPSHTNGKCFVHAGHAKSRTVLAVQDACHMLYEKGAPQGLMAKSASYVHGSTSSPQLHRRKRLLCNNNIHQCHKYICAIQELDASYITIVHKTSTIIHNYHKQCSEQSACLQL